LLQGAVKLLEVMLLVDSLFGQACCLLIRLDVIVTREPTFDGCLFFCGLKFEGDGKKCMVLIPTGTLHR
jgi:hypothetical protein